MSNPTPEKNSCINDNNNKDNIKTYSYLTYMG